MADIEDDGFITVWPSPPLHPLEDRCADCQRWIAPDGSGHLGWYPFDGYKEFPRLLPRDRHSATNIGE